MAKTELLEHVGGDFGVTVIYELSDEAKASVSFRAHRISARGMPDNRALYERAGATSSGDDVEDTRDAANYFRGFVKWDGCSHVYFGEADNAGYLHLCGQADFALLRATLEAVYFRCGELMRERGVDLLDDEFKGSRISPIALSEE